MYKKVLLCIPPIPDIWGWPTDPHLGIGYLSSFLSMNDIENDVLDMRLGYKTDDLIRRINKFRPDLIGMSIVSYRHDIAYDLIKKIKNSDCKIVIGGAHVSTTGKEALQECPVDFAVKLEGEYTLLELCRGKDPAEIKGLIYRSKTGIIENEDRPFIKDLDGLPFPKYEKFELEKYSRRLVSILSSRGCPYQCIYCAVKVCMGREYRVRTPENVVAELKYWYERDYREFDFLDDIPNFYKERIYGICRLIEENELKDLDLKCGNGLRADLVDRDLLKRMFEVGFKKVAFGVESGSDKILRRIKKGEDISVIKKAIQDACEIGYDVFICFMVGHPDETPADFEESIKLALEYPISAVRFFNIVPFPGTELYNWVRDNNYFVKGRNGYLNCVSFFANEPIFATPEFPYKERKKALIRAKKIIGYVGRRAMERKLHRYTFLSKPIASLVYSSLGRKIIFRAMINKTFKRISILILKIFGLNFYMS